jgi:hypothetical protein
MLPKRVVNELQEKAFEIMKKEGTYLKFMRYAKRGHTEKAQDMMEDLFNRYGQDLSGDPTKKINIGHFGMSNS